MKKRALVAAFASLTLTLCLAGCGQAPGAGGEVTISVKVPTLSLDAQLHPEVSSAYEFMQVAANRFEQDHDGVKVEVTEFPIEDETAAIGDTLGTPQAPDVLFEGYFNMGSYIHTGYVVPMDDVISDEVRADIPDAYWEMSQVDGKTYIDRKSVV